MVMATSNGSKINSYLVYRSRPHSALKLHFKTEMREKERETEKKTLLER